MFRGPLTRFISRSLSLSRVTSPIRNGLVGLRHLGSSMPSAESSTASSASPSTEDISSGPQSLLRRAILYVPGSDVRKIDKARGLQEVDSIVLDCEDGVAVNQKEQARRTIRETLNQLVDDSGNLNQPLWERLSVRINSMTSGNDAELDLQEILSGTVVPRTLLLPKVDTREDIDHFAEHLQKALKSRNGGEGKKEVEAPEIDLVIYVESARGLLDLREICQHAVEMSEFTRFRLVGVVFGSDDFCASIGATRTDHGREVLCARQQVVMVAKSLDLQAIDAVYINFKDLEGLRAQSEEGAGMGFTGKQAIHPAQIQIIQEAFRPSDERIDWAKGLVQGFEAAQAEGKGAFVYRGQMIDMPLLRQAYNVLAIAKKIGKA